MVYTSASAFSMGLVICSTSGGSYNYTCTPTSAESSPTIMSGTWCSAPAMEVVDVFSFRPVLFCRLVNYSCSSAFERLAIASCFCMKFALVYNFTVRMVKSCILFSDKKKLCRRSSACICVPSCSMLL